WDPAGHANVPSFHPLEHDEWRQLVSGSGLHDAVKPHIEPNTYSYWDYRGGCFHRKQGMRIDHILVTECLLPRIESGWIQRDWRKKKSGLTPSDHCPVGITLTPG
ncbi:MAG: exodeoxyribonuclease-3, partial [Myxococcota bacterium]